MPHDKEQRGKKAMSAKGDQSAFDLWLNRGLHQLFDDVANEPIPEELLRLINNKLQP